MSIASEAFSALYPEKKKPELRIKYSSKFNDFNANVYYRDSWMEFRLSRKWKSVSKDIKIGLLQTLILKVYKDNQKTMNIDFYNIFLRKVHQTVQKTKTHPILEDSFNRVNEYYFDGLIEMPNLVFGGATVRKLGSYEYGSDTVMISSILKEYQDLIDYVMYHELLHKKFKFKVSGSRSYHHTKEFRQAEKNYDGHEFLERKLQKVISRKRFFKIF